MKRFLLIASALLVLSCKSGNDGLNLVQYREGEQLLTMNGVERNGEEFIAPRILRLSKDSVLVGEELLVKIFLNDKDIAIVDAFVDCKLVANPSVDTTTYSVSGCSRGLIVQGDTIFIGFRPSEPGVKRFSEITILTRDRARIFRTLQYSFDYKVNIQHP